jgi:hypothetical protein
MIKRKNIDFKLKKVVEDSMNTNTTNGRIMGSNNEKSSSISRVNPSLAPMIKDNNNLFPSYRKKHQINENELFEKYNSLSKNNDSLYTRDLLSSNSKKIEKIEPSDKIDIKVLTVEESNTKQNTLESEKKVEVPIVNKKQNRKIYIFLFLIILVIIIAILIYYKFI